MDNQLVTFKDKSLELLNVSGKPAFTAETIGNALEYADPRDNVNMVFNRNLDEFEEGIDYLRLQIEGTGQRREIVAFTLTGVTLLCMFSNQPLAKEFRRWAKHVLANGQAQPKQQQLATGTEQVFTHAQVHSIMKNMIPMSHYQELLAENLKMRQSIANAKQIIAHEKLSRILVAGEIETENFARLMKMRAEGETTVDQIATAIGYKPKFVRTLIKLYREASGQSARNKNWII